jgi:phage terminase large subunit GpA-like protein
MLSPWVTLQELVAGFLVARAAGRESFRVWVNTLLGEPWDDRTARQEASALMVRVEDYGALPDGTPIEVPMPAVALTAGVDVQAACFLLSVYAWGPAGERWLVDRQSVPGDPRKAETQGALLESLDRRYQHASGHLLPIHATCIDSGYASDDVYTFVLRHQARRIYATKGDAGKTGEPLIWRIAPPASGQTTTKSRATAAKAKKLIRPVALYHVNVDDGKAQIMASLALAAPGPNFIHFPAGVDGVDSEFFAQLCSEHKETRYNRGGVAVASVWVQDRTDNHALDEAVLALVAVRILRPNLADMAQRIRAALPPTPAGPPAEGSERAPLEATPGHPEMPPPPPAAPVQTSARPARRVWHSSYLGR